MAVLYPHFGREFHKHIKKRTVDYTALSSFTTAKSMWKITKLSKQVIVYLTTPLKSEKGANLANSSKVATSYKGLLFSPANAQKNLARALPDEENDTLICSTNVSKTVRSRDPLSCLTQDEVNGSQDTLSIQQTIRLDTNH